MTDDFKEKAGALWDTIYSVACETRVDEEEAIERALRLAHESGRRSGLEEAAKICEQTRLGAWGKVSDIAEDIRALLTAPTTGEKM